MKSWLLLAGPMVIQWHMKECLHIFPQSFPSLLLTVNLKGVFSSIRLFVPTGFSFKSHPAHLPRLYFTFFFIFNVTDYRPCRGGNSYPLRSWHHCCRWQNVDLWSLLKRPGFPPSETWI